MSHAPRMTVAPRCRPPQRARSGHGVPAPRRASDSSSSMAAMTELPVGDDHQVIRLGGEAAVVVPLDEYRRLRELERRAQLAEQADAEEAEALAEYRAQQDAG